MKNKLIEEAIELTYSSLKSHLPWTYETLRNKKDILTFGTKQHHIRCIKEYARVITILTDLL